MKCTGKEWDTCRGEKMGCEGCYYEITQKQKLEKIKYYSFKEIENWEFKYLKNKFLSLQEISKIHESLIQTLLKQEKLWEESIKIGKKELDVLLKENKNLKEQIKQSESTKQELIKNIEQNMERDMEIIKHFEKLIQSTKEDTRDRRSWLRTKTIALTNYEYGRSMLKELKKL